MVLGATKTVRRLVWVLGVGAAAGGCGDDDASSNGASGAGGSLTAGAGGVAGSAAGGSSGASSGGTGSGGTAVAGSGGGNFGGAGGVATGGSSGAAGQGGGNGGGAGNVPTFIGGCPDGNACPSAVPGNEASCSPNGTCCNYQAGSTVVSCLCADGEFTCGAQTCACP